MKNTRLPILALFVALALMSHAVAATESFSHTIANTEGGSANNSSFTLNGFDPTLGTLNSITFDFELTSTATPTIFASGTGSYTGATTTYDFSLTGPSLSETVTTSAGPDSGTDVAGANPAATVTKMTSDAPVLSANFAAYESGPVTYDITSSPFTSGGSPGAGSTGFTGFGGDGFYNGSLSVTYDYTAAVPEPNLPSLLSLGLGMLAFWSFRLRRLNS
jgi:hypothetical protein